MNRFAVLLLLFPAVVFAETINVDQWLLMRQTLTPPVFGETADAATLLNATDSDPRVRPAAALGWRRVHGDVLYEATATAVVLHTACYVESPRWQKPALHVACSAPFRVELNGEPLGDANDKDGERYALKKTVTLPRGKHLLRIKVAAAGETSLQASFAGEPLAISVTADPAYSLADYAAFTLFDDLSSAVISPDGKFVAVVRASYNGSTKKESWLEVREFASSRLVYTLRPAQGIGNVRFLPSPTPTLHYTLSGADGADIWLLEPGTLQPRCVKRGVQGLVKIAGGHRQPHLYFTADKAASDREHDWQLFDELEDRMADWTRRRVLYELNFASGDLRALTAVGDSFALDEFALAPEDNQILFTRRIPRTGRPFYTTEFWLYETVSGAARKILEQSIAFETRPLSFTWLDDTHVAFVSAAYLTTDDDTSDRNHTQTALWLLNTKTAAVRNLTAGSRYSLDENETRGALRWNAAERKLWMHAVRGGELQLLRIDPFADKPQAERVRLSKPFVKEFDLSPTGRCAAILSAPVHPNALYGYNSATHKETLLLDPHAGFMSNVELAAAEPWSFVNSDGDSIEGWLYLPADFSPAKQWPLVVYYYGGVSPRDLRWQPRYHWLCANGYVVYVLNPVGAIGYGPEFADKHSHDWGTRAARDVMDGVRKLLAAKPYLDSLRIGAYGGSYGGFLTMDLATKTDMFAALASLSGISNIASYFAGGTWGFTYGDIALPRSFPWNRRDVFVDKSPLFNADKITTPLLLMHGERDTNVPSLESEQMFVALKLLGQKVAYVRFAGEDHSFTKHKNRVAEFEMLLEWFDLHLKQEPAAWNARWE